MSSALAAASAGAAGDARAELARVTETLQKLAATRQQLVVQLNENEGVKAELDALSADAEVFRSVGPALLKMDASDAKALVGGRITAIKADVQRVEEQFEEAGKRRLEVVERLSAGAPGSARGAAGAQQ